MKKTYIAPCMEIVKVQTVVMVATSTMELNRNSDYKVSGSSALSRGGNGGWDDDE